MTKSHCFCAICGAPTGRLEWDASSADTYSPHLVKPSAVEWLADVGLIIYNTKDGLPAMFLSYEHEDARRFRLAQEMTDHFKKIHKLPVEEDKTCEAYSPSNGQPVVFPIHYSCRQMLNEVPGPWPQDNVLYETLESHCTVVHGFVRALDYDYGSVSYANHKRLCSMPIAQLQNGGFWKIKKGSEYAVLSPDEIQDIDKLVGKLIELAKVGWPSTESQPLTPELSKHHRIWLEKFNDDLPWAQMLFPSTPLSTMDGTWLQEVIVYTKLTIPYEEGWSHKTKIKGLKLVLTNGQSAELGRCHGFTPEVYKAPPGHFMAGISVDWAENRPIKRLEFYCQPISKTPPESHARFVERGCTPPKPIPGLQAYIDVEKRPNHMALKPNAQPAMQHLILAKREFDLDSLESFGVDTHLGGFELKLYGQRRIVIGPRRRTMKYLAFEGKTDKDDWIIGCWIHKSNGKPVGLRFFTRKGRQLIAGEPGTDGEPHMIGKELERWAPAKSFISELSAAWSYTESGKPEMTAFGAALGNDLPSSCLVENLVPSSCVELNLADGPEKDVYLDSTSSPMCIPHIVNSRGPQTVFGRERSSDELFHRNGRKRSDRRIVSYLDLSGPIRTVKATFCHMPKTGQLPLVAMFVDRKNHPREKRDRHGTTKLRESSFGPTLFDKEELCECKNFPELYDPQTIDCAHYSETESNFGGREIQSIRIWLTDDNILAGRQFVTVGDQKGPEWATGVKDKGTKFVQVNRLPSPARKETGLVLFLDSNESPSAYDDIVVVGIRPVGFSVDAPLIRRDN